MFLAPALAQRFFCAILPIALLRLSVPTGGTYDARRADPATDSAAAGHPGPGLTGEPERTVECVRDARLSVQSPRQPQEAWALLSAQFYRGGQELHTLRPEGGPGRGAAAAQALSAIQGVNH